MTNLLTVKYTPIPKGGVYSTELVELVHSCLVLDPSLRPRPEAVLAAPFVVVGSLRQIALETEEKLRTTERRAEEMEGRLRKAEQRVEEMEERMKKWMSVFGEDILDTAFSGNVDSTGNKLSWKGYGDVFFDAKLKPRNGIYQLVVKLIHVGFLVVGVTLSRTNRCGANGPGGWVDYNVSGNVYHRGVHVKDFAAKDGSTVILELDAQKRTLRYLVNGKAHPVSVRNVPLPLFFYLVGNPPTVLEVVKLCWLAGFDNPDRKSVV